MENKDIQLLEAGLGNVTWWGYSPSFSIIQDIEASPNEVNILLLGASDGRHLLEALASNDPSPHSFDSLNFWILEQNLMTYARQMFFISLFYDEAVSSSEKAKIFLEIFGNTQLRPSTFKYFTEKSEELCQVIVDEANKEEGEENKLSSKWIRVDMSNLRYKDLDNLEGIFKLWTAKGREAMDVKTAFDVRIRQIMQNRLEQKEGVFDMDYQMRLVDRGGAYISRLEYKHWRFTGNAYDFLEDATEDKANYEPNNSLISSLVTHKCGNRLSRRGYWGDIVTGPFISFGHKYQAEVSSLDDAQSRRSQALSVERAEMIFKGFNPEVEPLHRVSILFLPTKTDHDLNEKYDAMEDELEESVFVSRHRASFDRVFISCSVSHLLSAALVKCLRPQKGLVFIETPLYLLHMANEVILKFKEYLLQFTAKYDLNLEDYDPMQQSCVKIHN